MFKYLLSQVISGIKVVLIILVIVLPMTEVKLERVKILKHDRYQQDLCSKLQDRYDKIYTNVPLYSNTHRKQVLVGEIDILALKGSVYDIFEVKCSHRISKARKQLDKIRKLVSKHSEVRNTFFYCGATDEILEM
jgi:hypothetical protein